VSEDNNNGGCGCFSLIVFIMLITALFFGLPIGKGKWNIDIFPPRIWDMNDVPKEVPKPEVETTYEEPENKGF
jgi:hypothetical protein